MEALPAAVSKISPEMQRVSSYVNNKSNMTGKCPRIHREGSLSLNHSERPYYGVITEPMLLPVSVVLEETKNVFTSSLLMFIDL
jgi:hypothetical protein